MQKITIENFKCFHSKTEIELGKLTLLTGANSSGKSSIIYSILGAIQSGEFPFQFSSNGKYVNMGDFNEIVFNHDKARLIKLAFTFSNGTMRTVETVWKENIKTHLLELSELNAQSNYFNLLINNKNGGKYVIDFNYNPEKNPKYEMFSKDTFKKIFMTLSNSFEEIMPEKTNKNNNANKINEIFEKMITPQNIKGLVVDGFSREKIKNEALFDIIQDTQKYFNAYEDNLNFICSFRFHPERGDLETTRENLKVGAHGEGYLDQIIAWETKEPEKIKKLTKILNEINLLNDIKSKRTTGGKYDLLVKTKKQGVYASLYDVGFGVSQFLPIIVADLQLKKNSTLFVAQPEIHLHPSVQSSFGDYLLRQIHDSSKKYVIETHSEYLLNKIRLGIVKGKIAENDVKVLFVDNDGAEAIVHKITFNKQGQILNAPENFFKTYMIDVMDIAIHAANEL